MANNTRFDWLGDVAAAVEAAVKQPKFPGDGSFALPLLEKLVNKLFGECHNGGEVGRDGCPACRAHRTESAEAQRARVEAAYDDALHKLRHVEETLVATQALASDLTEKVRVGEDATKFALQNEKKFLAQFDVQNAQLVAAATERGELLKHLEEQKEALQQVQQYTEHLEQRIKAFAALVAQLRDV